MRSKEDAWTNATSPTPTCCAAIAAMDEEIAAGMPELPGAMRERSCATWLPAYDAAC